MMNPAMKRLLPTLSWTVAIFLLFIINSTYDLMAIYVVGWMYGALFVLKLMEKEPPIPNITRQTEEPPKEIWLEKYWSARFNPYQSQEHSEPAECFTRELQDQFETKYILASRVNLMVKLARLEADQRWRVSVYDATDPVTSKKIEQIKEQLQ